MKTGLVCLLVCGVYAATATVSSGSVDKPIDLAANSKAAREIVVATVTDVESRFDVNAFGDRLIVSDLQLKVEETLKGVHADSITMTVEGGTVGDLTLRVSDLPRLSTNDRAVFFLESLPSGRKGPYARGHGILKLDSANRLAGTDTTLNEVRAAVRSGLR